MKIKLVACGVFEPELSSLVAQAEADVHVVLLEAGLHATPLKLREVLQAHIDSAAAEGYEVVALGYGLCGRGTAGLVAREVTVVIPRVHDCLTLFLGSREEYRRQFRQHPGTYYLTPGWYAHKLGGYTQDRLRRWSLRVEDDPNWPELVEKYGADAAAAIIEFRSSWKRNYTRVAVIDTGCAAAEDCLQLAGRIAENLGWQCERLAGSTRLLQALIQGGWDEREFLVLRPGQRAEASGEGQVLVAVGRGAASSASPAQTPVTELVQESGAAPRRGLGLGIDAGGTYTDAVIYDFATGQVLGKAKSPTTQHDPLIGIQGALDGLDPELLPRVNMVALSTTFATNAIVEDRGGVPGCLLMPAPGFDADELRWPHYAIIPGRISIQGEELEPFDQQTCARAVRRLLGEGVDSLAISGYGSTRNPAHELAAREVANSLCDLPVVCGHELSGRLNFVERANTAALNARLLPLIAQLLDAATRTLAARGVLAPLMVVKGDGSLINAATARQRPIDTVLSGPAASVFGARALSGQSNAAVVDIGGTTTDTALLRGGKPRLSPEGARVGRWRTSVEAVEISTIGLGGDSALDFDADRRLLIGPRRALPLCFLAAEQPERVMTHLERVARDDGAVRTNASSLDLLTLGPMRTAAGLTPLEAQVMAEVQRGPLGRGELAHRLGLASARLLNTRRLEDRGLLQRVALTPTDLLHVTGEFARFCREAAVKGLAVFARLFGAAPQEIISLAREGMTRMLCQVLMSAELDGQMDLAEELASSPALALVFQRMLAPEEDGVLGFRAHYRRPVVAIGAPAHVFLPPVGERLGCEVIVPAHAEVANAVGAVVSNVSVSETVAIRPSEFDGFTVYAPRGRCEFEELEQATRFACSEAARAARERAVAAGALDPQVEVEVERRHGRVATGELQLIQVNVRATAFGHPTTSEPAAAASG